MTWFDDAKADDTEALKEAINAGQDVNAVNAEDLNRTALMYAAEHGKVKACNVLIDGGANINMGHRYKKTALMYGSEKGWLDVVKLLVAEGADVNGANEYGETALIFAAQHRNWEVVELLVENGAFLAPSAKADDAPEGDMEPPLTARAATNKEEVKQSVAMLKERFANMSAAGASNSMPLETPGRQSIQKGGVAAAAAKFS